MGIGFGSTPPDWGWQHPDPQCEFPSQLQLHRVRENFGLAVSYANVVPPARQNPRQRHAKRVRWATSVNATPPT